ncbi:fructose PTS transporter subunit IIA [Parafannyhessea umbonata]|uniref:PTS system, fructose-specific IIA component n=1 Tax=Parafannyhessea umbonata TaxID=604330 RepID=A0A1H9N449_9ACTN|nr:fructose PTS transporter subunit IIA [Parafannyhessea umbonata]SER30736.1 PTS system, fructose-specific IIA component [Parafannyhessea umbonata]
MESFVRKEHVSLENPAATTAEALAFLAHRAVELGVAQDEDAVLKAFQAREALGTTGMTEGFSIPHAKSDAIQDAAVLVTKYAEPIADWESLDGKPIKASIALLVPDGEAGTTHIKLLSKVAVLLMREDFRTKVLTSTSPEEIASLVCAGIED